MSPLFGKLNCHIEGAEAVSQSAFSDHGVSPGHQDMTPTAAGEACAPGPLLPLPLGLQLCPAKLQGTKGQGERFKGVDSPDDAEISP